MKLIVTSKVGIQQARLCFLFKFISCIHDKSIFSTDQKSIRTYADKTHHGKEEYILFRDLAEKNMDPSDKQLMQELKEEHTYGRKIVAELVQAKEDYLKERKQALWTIKDNLEKLILFYPEHITKEDKVFFPNTEKYLTEEDQERMLKEFWEFDRRMIHDKYKSVVELLGFDKTT